MESKNELTYLTWGLVVGLVGQWLMWIRGSASIRYLGMIIFIIGTSIALVGRNEQDRKNLHK